MLTSFQKKKLIKNFPEIELSYEKVLHKKVYANLHMIIPKGPKAFLWITPIEDKNCAVLFVLDNRNKIKNITIHPMCFDNVLAFGTLIYGTYFTVNSNKHFTCEDIFFYKGVDTREYSMREKIKTFKDMFNNNILQKSFNNNFLIPGLPILTSNYQESISHCINIPYKVYGIKFFNLNNNRFLGTYLYKEKVVPEAIFRVQADIQNDIYKLFCYEFQSTQKPYSIAAITSYKQSVILNNLFRTIKENYNLDLLEESDEEEEFENISEDKYVDLKKQIIMKCVYRKQFNKWEPIEVIKDKVKIVTRKEAYLLEKKV